MSIHRGETEPLKNFESRFEAQLSKFNPLGSSVSLPKSISALVLLANLKVDSSQRISILAAAAPKESNLSTRASIEDYVKAVKYEAISSLLRQCHRPTNGDYSSKLTVNWAFQPHLRPRNSRKMSHGQLIEMKGKTKCGKCGKYGHWYAEHESDGRLNANV